MCNKNSEVSSLPSLSSLPLALSVSLFLPHKSVGGRSRSSSDDDGGNASVQHQERDCKLTYSDAELIHRHCLVMPKLDVSNEITA